MDSLGGIVGLGFMVLMVVMLLLFQSQFAVLLKRLSLAEFGSRKNKKAQMMMPKDNRPWSWHKTLIMTLFHPNIITAQAILSEAKITLRKVIVWLVIYTVLDQFIRSLISFIKRPALFTPQNVGSLLFNGLLSCIISVIGVFVTTGFIHYLAKSFKGQGTWQNFFIIYVSFYIPSAILFTISSLIYQIFTIQILVALGLICGFYLLYVTTIAVQANYRFTAQKAFRINFLASIILFVVVATGNYFINR